VRTEQGAFGLVMELLEGRDLETHFTDLETRGVRPRPAWIKATFAPIVDTLAIMHGRGLVHRDLKAENIFLIDEAKGGGVRLLDFGFVKLLRSPTITGEGMMGGSPGYLPPETWHSGAWTADVQSDVYSLSVILFRALAGRLPFDGTIIELMQSVTTDPRPRLHMARPDFSPDLDAWVEQALAIKREDRFASVNAAWRALCACFP
jgi:eukaryotic-like serine/threonine-protein kinase